MIITAPHINDFENLYVRLRKKEGRMYSDEEVASLPAIYPGHPHHKEWLLRKKSSEGLIGYLTNKKQPFRIIEIGCGNGWLSHRMSQIPGATVIGTDIQFTELEQAARVFSSIDNLHFIFGPDGPSTFAEQQADIIVFAASIQYFASLTKTIAASISLLRPGGEIHIIDTAFYKKEECLRARKRTQVYFTGIGFETMAEYYFHHCISELEAFNYRLLYRPSAWKSLFGNSQNPFPWICIKKEMK